MNGIAFLAVIVCASGLTSCGPEDTPTAQDTVMTPRAQLYTQLDALYSAIERKSQTITTVAGRPPIPVRFSFTRRDGEMLDMTATAGFRTVELKVWLIDGERPGETVLKVKADPASMLKATGDTELQRSIQTILENSDAQVVEGHRVTALFGEGPNASDAATSD